MRIERIHFSNKKLTQLNRFHERGPRGHNKPPGFWYSVQTDDNDHGWLEWCKGNDNFRDISEQVPHRLEVDMDRVLHISNQVQLTEFSEKHSFKSSPGGYFSSIRWEDVMPLWSGIEISPYQWSCRMSEDFFWYYGWDCSSGVIWDMDAIKSITPIDHKDVPTSGGVDGD